jgi:tetratricopeptide (TPR) repeat protein
VALITGGARIGQDVARALALRGCSIALTYRRSREVAEAAAGAAKDAGVSAVVLHADATDENIASQLSDPKLEARVLGARSTVNSIFFRLREAAADGFLCEQLGGSETPPWQRALQLRVLHQTLLYLGRPEEALRIADELEPLARKIGDTFTAARCLSTRAWAEFGKAPDLAKLEIGLEQVSGQSEQSGFWEAVFRTQLSLLDFFRGNWEGALLQAQAACRHELGGGVEGIGVGTLFLQMAYAGDRDRALAILDEKRALLPRSGQPNSLGSWWMLALVIEGFVMLGEQSQAGQLYPLVCELVGIGAVVLLPISRFAHTIAGVGAAAAGQWEAAEGHFQIAMQQAESFPNVLEQAELRRFHAMMLIDRAGPGDRETARKLLSEALETYTQIGMPRHIEMIQTLLGQATGG